MSASGHEIPAHIQRYYASILDERDSTIEGLQKLLEEAKREKKAEKIQKEKRDSDIIQLQKSLEKAKRENEAEKRQKEEYLHRLSEVAGSKLTDSNPNVTDLSDANRPTKLAESFSELYDNDWTDAFTGLTEKLHMDEQDAIDFLFSVLKRVFQTCSKQAEENLESLQQAITTFIGTEDNDTEIKMIYSKLKTLRKASFDKSKDNVEMDILSLIQPKIDPEKFDVSLTYIMSCIGLCWRMVAQDPPVYIDVKCPAGKIFNKDVFRAYTKEGSTVEYVVWPALYLHAGGALLCKGVAQGSRKRKSDESSGSECGPKRLSLESTSSQSCAGESDTSGSFSDDRSVFKPRSMPFETSKPSGQSVAHRPKLKATSRRRPKPETS